MWHFGQIALTMSTSSEISTPQPGSAKGCGLSAGVDVDLAVRPEVLRSALEKVRGRAEAVRKGQRAVKAVVAGQTLRRRPGQRRPGPAARDETCEHRRSPSEPACPAHCAPFV